MTDPELEVSRKKYSMRRTHVQWINIASIATYNLCISMPTSFLPIPVECGPPHSGETSFRGTELAHVNNKVQICEIHTQPLPLFLCYLFACCWQNEEMLEVHPALSSIFGCQFYCGGVPAGSSEQARVVQTLQHTHHISWSSPPLCMLPDIFSKIVPSKMPSVSWLVKRDPLCFVRTRWIPIRHVLRQESSWMGVALNVHSMQHIIKSLGSNKY